jgi:hypothetical protein
MTDEQRDALDWIAWVNAERRHADAPRRDLSRLWVRRILWNLRGTSHG